MTKILPKSMYSLLLFVALILNAGPVLGQQQLRVPSTPATITFYLENDVFSKTDENYTHGCGLSWVSRDFRPAHTPFYARPLFALLSLFSRNGQQRNVSLSFRQNIYTPRNISTPELIRADQPYAGVTYFPIGVHQKTGRHISSMELDIGIVGPHSYAADSQKKLHELIDSPDPRGWNNQLKDEPIINLNYDYRWRSFKKTLFGRLGMDLLPHWGAVLGNMRTAVNGGAQFRVGWFLPNNFGSYIIQPSCECQIPEEGEAGLAPDPYPAFSVNIYAILDGQVVLRDIFLDGNTFKDSHRVDKKSMVGIMTLGVGFQIHHFKIDYSYMRQTRTFRTQATPHQYGGVTISMLF